MSALRSAGFRRWSWLAIVALVLVALVRAGTSDGPPRSHMLDDPKALVVADSHFDRPWFCYFLFGKDDAQNAVFEIRPDLLSVNGFREREASGKRSVTALDPVIGLAVGVLLELSLALDGQSLIF